MKVKRTISALLAAACLSAGTNLLISNAAAVAPESIVSDAAYDKVNANYQGEINDLESRFDQITNMIRELLARMDNERSQLIAMEDEYVYMIDSGASKNKLKSKFQSMMSDLDSNMRLFQSEMEDISYRLRVVESEALNLCMQMASGNDERDSDIAALTSENKKLASENSSLTADNKELTTANSKLTSENKTLTSENQTLKSKVSSLETENKELKQEIEDYDNNIMRLDANNDGYLNAIDASILLKIYAYNSTYNTPLKTISELKDKGIIS